MYYSLPQAVKQEVIAPSSPRYSPSPVRNKRGMRVPEGTLCEICFDVATGHHYDAVSCNGCRIFFRPLQGTRDRRSSTVSTLGQKREFGTPVAVNRERVAINTEVVDRVSRFEQLCQQLRVRSLREPGCVQWILAQPSLLHMVDEIQLDPDTTFTELRPATMIDIQAWNIRELRACLEWAKTFQAFQSLEDPDRLALMKKFAFSFNILNRVYYSLDHGPGMIVYPSGAFITSETHESFKIAGCRFNHQQQIENIMLPLREMSIQVSELALYKAILLFNPDADGLVLETKPFVADERQKYTTALSGLMIEEHGQEKGVQRYADLLLMGPSLQSIVDQNVVNMRCMESWQGLEHFWKMSEFVKELCML
ncbi:CBN-NHR-1 protein [Aphelenchoides avenae]|nr:CBN-NHR-1 protein [Aphelenchus avenae]